MLQPLVGFFTLRDPIEPSILANSSKERSTPIVNPGNESAKSGDPFIEALHFLDALGGSHVEDSSDFVRIRLDSSSRDDDPEELPRGDLECTLLRLDIEAA